MPHGLINLKEVEATITPETALVSAYVNNKIKVIQLIEDAAQAVGKIPGDVNKMKIDFMSISGHKIFGPKGIWPLYVGRRPRVRLESLQSDG